LSEAPFWHFEKDFDLNPNHVFSDKTQFWLRFVHSAISPFLSMEIHRILNTLIHHGDAPREAIKADSGVSPDSMSTLEPSVGGLLLPSELSVIPTPARDFDQRSLNYLVTIGHREPACARTYRMSLAIFPKGNGHNGEANAVNGGQVI
jgi:hypothetical protein